MNFNEKVYQLVKKVPKGKVTTYGTIAAKLGNPRWSRQVGWALHANRSNGVPCHRVVDRTGRIAPNFAFDGAEEQRRRLEAEGVKFQDPMHVDSSCIV
ncbi:MGMT family protein [Candidatus Curtissbacteria bacterium]|nr:MGMT family protein [Candidatus Curtissbacteria bacterium]